MDGDQVDTIRITSPSVNAIEARDLAAGAMQRWGLRSDRLDAWLNEAKGNPRYREPLEVNRNNLTPSLSVAIRRSGVGDTPWCVQLGVVLSGLSPK